MSNALMESIRIYYDRSSDDPSVFAAFADGRFRFKGEEEKNGFLFGVNLALSERPKTYLHENSANFRFSFEPGFHPLPIEFPQLPTFRSDAWIEAKPDAEIRQWIFLLLSQTKGWMRLRTESDIDLDTGRETVSIKSRPKEKKIAFLRWLVTWQLPKWKLLGTENSEAFSEIQAMAVGYKVKPFSSKSNFDDVIGELRRS